MKKYIIDGNNLIGKIRSLSILQSKDKQASREKLAFLIDRYFTNKKAEVSLHFDGFVNNKINTPRINLIYSNELSADERIKKQIESVLNRRNLIVISSDNNLKEFAKVCGCKCIQSEEFGKELLKGENIDDEESRIKAMDDVNMFKKLFES
ncbi:MAG: NYN domain-containing protein [Ignavibacteriaceae bacterium]|nr:NYN domain-containing protein [Ignavibacteriaceae bacterium]